MHNFWMLLILVFRTLEASLIQHCRRTTCSSASATICIPESKGCITFWRQSHTGLQFRAERQKGTRWRQPLSGELDHSLVLQWSICELQLSCPGKAMSGNLVYLPLASSPERLLQRNYFLSWVQRVKPESTKHAGSEHRMIFTSRVFLAQKEPQIFFTQ